MAVYGYWSELVFPVKYLTEELEELIDLYDGPGDSQIATITEPMAKKWRV